MQNSSRRPHDRSQRLLFSHPRVIRDLLVGFVREPWVQEVDFSSLESLPSDFVSGDLPGDYEERGSDVVWKVGFRGRDLYVIILLELQSRSDREMALRLAVYVLLLYQRLRRQGLLVGELLPPVFPLVFYNGDRPWSAPTQLSELIQPVPEDLEAYRPSMRYGVVDEKRWPESELLPENIVAGMVRAEQAGTVEDIEVAASVFETCAPDQEENRTLRRDLLAWLAKVVVPNLVEKADVPKLKDFYEFKTYMETHMHKWSDQWKAEGEQIGIQKGREEGRQEAGADILRSLLKLKFGPEAVTDFQEPIARSDAEQLRIWAERVLTADSPEDVFRS